MIDDYESFRELVKLVLVCRPENQLFLTEQEMLQAIFDISANAHAYILQNIAEVDNAYRDDAPVIKHALELSNGKELTPQAITETAQAIFAALVKISSEFDAVQGIKA